MNYKYVAQFLFLSIFLFISFNGTYASSIDTTGNEILTRRTSQETKDFLESREESNPFHSIDLFGKIEYYLSLKDLRTLRAVSKKINEAVSIYVEEPLKPFIDANLNVIDGDFSFENLPPKTKDILYKRDIFALKYIEKRVPNNKYAFVVKGSPLIPFLNLSLIKDGSHQVVSAFEIYKLAKERIDPLLFGKNQKDSDYNSIRAQHLFSHIRLYAATQNKVEALNTFWRLNKEKIMSYLKELLLLNKYVKFDYRLSLQDLEGANYHIVTTDTQMTEQKNKDHLQNLLQFNPNHRVVLDVLGKLVSEGTLRLARHQIPSNLAHLIITNIYGNAKRLEKNFLYHRRDIESNLQSLDTAGLTSVEKIGNHFLSADYGIRPSARIKSIDNSGFINVKKIGIGFMVNASEVKFFDTSDLINLRKIKYDFLSGVGIDYFDTSGLLELRHAGTSFLQCANNLKHIDSSGLIKLSEVPISFLSKTPVENNIYIKRIVIRNKENLALQEGSTLGSIFYRAYGALLDRFK